MILLNSASTVNAYLGAWITAGVAAGGLLFEAIRSIVSSIGNVKIAKSNNETKIKLSELDNRRKEAQQIESECQYIRQTFSDYCGYTAALLNSDGKLYAKEQAAAFGAIALYLTSSQNVVSFIQSEIVKGNYENALSNFENILGSLKEEETHLLSQLKQHLPKGYTDDSLG